MLGKLKVKICENNFLKATSDRIHIYCIILYMPNTFLQKRIILLFFIYRFNKANLYTTFAIDTYNLNRTTILWFNLRL